MHKALNHMQSCSCPASVTSPAGRHQTHHQLTASAQLTTQGAAWAQTQHTATATAAAAAAAAAFLNGGGSGGSSGTKSTRSCTFNAASEQASAQTSATNRIYAQTKCDLFHADMPVCTAPHQHEHTHTHTCRTASGATVHMLCCTMLDSVIVARMRQTDANATCAKNTTCTIYRAFTAPDPGRWCPPVGSGQCL